jgi:hypothetical protein
LERTVSDSSLRIVASVENIHDADAGRDSPASIATLKTIDVTPARRTVERRSPVHRAKNEVGFGVGDVAVDFGDMACDHMLGSLMGSLLLSQYMIDEAGGGPDIVAMVIDGVWVIGGCEHVPVKPIDAPAEAHDAVVDVLTILQFSNCIFEISVHGFPPI